MSDMPELDIDTANHAGVRVRGYSVETVRRLIAESEALREDAERSKAISGAVFGVLEGHNIPHVTRKVLEAAYYSGIDVFAEDDAIDQARGAQ